MLAKISNTKNEYSENLLTPFCTFDKTHTWNIISGGVNGTVTNSSKRYFTGSKSLRIEFNDSNAPIVFSSGGTEMNFTAKQDGIYILALKTFVEQSFDVTDINLKVNVFKNNVLFLELALNPSTIDFGVWSNFAQSFELEKDDVINFTFATDSAKGLIYYIDGLKLELDDKNLFAPSVYTRPFEQITGWESRLDTLNSQALTANIENKIQFSGVSESNGLVGLINNVAKITPLNLNDAISVDFVFSFISPSGTNDYLSVMLKVNGNVYRAQSFQILEPTGELNYVAVSFKLPVMEEFFENGAEIFVKPSVAISISNRYLFVQRTHKGVE